MRKTINYGLVLYDIEDKMNITAPENSLNSTMEKIDETLKEKATIKDMENYIEEHKDELKGADGINGKDGYTPVKGVDYFDGKDGETGPQGIQGEKGPKGDTGSQGPSGKDGTNGIDGKDGYSPTAKVQTTSTGATITITDKNGTTTTNITNGKDGAKGDTGPAGKDGVSVTHSWNGTTLTVTSASGTSSANLKGDKGDTGATGPQGPQGPSGAGGAKGEDGVGILQVEQTTTSNADGGTNVITVTMTDGSTYDFSVKNGSKGSTGETGSKGADGYSPVKGKDYWTDSDKQEMTDEIINNLSGVPKDLLPYAKEGAKSINEALTLAGANKSAFLFYSDVHYTSGSGMSPYFLKYLYKNTGINKTIFAGDVVDNEGTAYNVMEYLWEWREKIKDLPNHHSVPGNHDDGNTTDRLFDENYVYGYLLAPEETPDIVRNTSGLYYYIDNPTERTRYLYLDTGYLDAYSLSTAQSEFIKNALISTQSGWHIVVIAHIWFMPDYDQYNIRPIPIKGLSDVAKAICTILNNYNERVGEFADCGAKIEFCIGGHVHRDFVGTTKFDTTNDGIPIIVVETDSRHLRSDLTYKENDITDLSVNGIIANYNTNMLHVVRVGRGNSFVVDLTNPTLVTRYSIVNDLTNVASSSSAIQIAEGGSFTTTLTVTAGELKSVVVTMNGVDITSTAYNASTGVVTIAKVTGNVVIKAIAEETGPAYTNVLETVGYETGKRINSAGNVVDRSDRCVTGMIPVNYGDYVYFKNIEMLDNDYGCSVAHYNSEGTLFNGASYLCSANPQACDWNTDGTLKRFRILHNENCKFVRFCFVKIDDTSIITVNEEIE